MTGLSKESRKTTATQNTLVLSGKTQPCFEDLVVVFFSLQKRLFTLGLKQVRRWVGKFIPSKLSLDLHFCCDQIHFARLTHIAHTTHPTSSASFGMRDPGFENPPPLRCDAVTAPDVNMSKNHEFCRRLFFRFFFNQMCINWLVVSTPLKNMRTSNWIISPGIRVENKKCLKPPTRYIN